MANPVPVVPSPKAHSYCTGATPLDPVARNWTVFPSSISRSGPASATAVESSLTMVAVAVAVPRVTPAGADRSRSNVSSASIFRSPRTKTITPCVVCPAANASVPLTAS